MKSIPWKLTSFILALTFIISLFAAIPVETFADESGDYSYETYYSYEPTYAMITGYSGSGGAITIPNKIDGYPVLGIASGAFYGCTNLTSVTLPSNIRYIESLAFEGCSKLAQINVSSTTGFFKSVNGVLLSEDRTTLVQYPMGKSGTTYNVPSGVKTIAVGAFDRCVKLTKVTLPAGITEIGDYAFRGCIGLSSMTLPDSLTTIGFYAYYGCESLTNITIPANVSKIGRNVFNFCTKLTQINVNNDNQYYKSVDGVLFVSQSRLMQYPNGRTNASYTIPEGTSLIDKNAIAGAVYLTELNISSKICDISSGEFKYCENLQSINVSPENNSYISIDGVLFNIADNGSMGLIQYPIAKPDREYTIPETADVVFNGAFCGCKSLILVTLPQNLNSIGSHAFAGCSITSIDIPASVVKIYDEAFADCKYLTRATFYGNTPETFEEYVFDGCASGFKIYYQTGTTGWTSPTWNGYASAEFNSDILAGADRYDTAVQISKKNCDTADTALLALGTNFPDALSGGSLAYQLDAPILLSKKDSLPAVTKSELARLGVSKVIVLGGEPAISAAVVTELQSMGITVERISGSNRYATAVAVAGSVRSYSGVLDTAVLASGENFPDALSMGSYAAKSGIPILLTQKASLSADTAAALVNFGITKVIVAGGTPAVSQAVLDTLDSMGIAVTVVSGSDRYATGTAAAGSYFSAVESAVVACGTNFPDALAAVPYAAKINAPILLVKPTGLPDSVRAFVTGSAITNFVYAGGDPAVGPAVRTALEGLI